MSHRFPLFVTSLAAALMIMACSPAAESAPSTEETSTRGATSQSSSSANGSVELFDSSVIHAIDVQFDQADYDAMVATFVESGEKEWIQASVTIDGVTYENVGLRLKGNSSLSGLGGRGPGGNQRPGGAAPEGMDPMGNGFGSATASEPENLPWLIRLDQFVEGQEHQGRVDVVVRSNNSQTSLNEAVALDLLEAAGLASQQAVSTTFTVNGSAPVLRLAVEHPDEDAWQDNSFEDKGALYKAESTGDWSYRGDDPEAYTEVFDQEGGKSVADLTPLIEFLDFINNADDATFAEELPERLDVEAFARYLAMMELINNFDDIDGPGNNSYLWYDVDSGQFTVVPWDMNLAFGGMVGGGGGFGGGGGRGGFTPGQLPEGFDPSQIPDGSAPGGRTFPGQVPGGDGFQGGPRGGGFGGGSNPLVQRFHANEEFNALYEEALATLRAELFESGLADELLAARVQTLTDQATGLVDSATIENEAASLSAYFEAE